MGTFEHGSDTPEGMIDAEAKVLSIAPASEATAEPAEGDGEYVIKLALEGQGEVAHECSLSPDQMPSVGDTVPVRVSTTDPSLFELDFDRARPQASGG
jgi:hypothetical protein